MALLKYAERSPDGAAAPAAADAWKCQLRPLADGAQPDIDHLDRLLGRMMRVALLVKLVEGGADRLHGRRA